MHYPFKAAQQFSLDKVYQINISANVSLAPNYSDCIVPRTNYHEYKADYRTRITLWCEHVEGPFSQFKSIRYMSSDIESSWHKDLASNETAKDTISNYSKHFINYLPYVAHMVSGSELANCISFDVITYISGRAVKFQSLEVQILEEGAPFGG